MFCQECGARNDDTDVFCASCGAKLMFEPEPEQVIPAQTPNVNMEYQNTGNSNGAAPMGNMVAPMENTVAPVVKKPLPKIYFVIAAEIIAILICGSMIKNAAEEKFSAGKVAEQYFVNLVNGNYLDAYDMLTVPENEFLSKDEYVQLMQQSTLGDVCDFKVEEKNAQIYEESEDEAAGGLGKSVNIIYRTTGQDYDDYYQLNLTKAKQKKYGLFEMWNVVDSSLWTKDVNLYVPSGSQVVVDGITLADKYVEEKEDGQDHYVLPYMFNCAHQVEVSHEGYESVNGVFQAYNGYAVYGMNYTQKTVEELQKLAVENLQAIYATAIAGKDFSQIKDLFVTDENDRAYIEEDYNYLVEAFESENYINTKLHTIKASSKADSSSICLHTEGTINYYTRDWWTGKKSKAQRDLNTDMYFTFVNEDGKWVQTSLGCSRLYY